MSSAARYSLSDGRMHLQHGPIDLVIEAWGPVEDVVAAYDQAEHQFDGVLDGLVAELPALRTPIGPTKPRVTGAIARRMVDAVWLHREMFVTPMAAVAGAVADHVLQALCCGRSLTKAYVNNGGDIALLLLPGETMALGLGGELAGLRGRVEIHSSMPIRGVATSGWRGRSFSLGIADAVTVLAKNAAMADVAATLIANEVSAEHPTIERLPACDLDPDSDLGELMVTVQVGELDPQTIAAALAAGMASADTMKRDETIQAAGLLVCGRFVDVGEYQALMIAGSSGVACSRTARSLG